MAGVYPETRKCKVRLWLAVVLIGFRVSGFEGSRGSAGRSVDLSAARVIWRMEREERSPQGCWGAVRKKSMLTGFSRVAVVAVMAVALPSCTGWPRGWAQAKAGRRIPADGVSGAWLGTWESGRSGHQGKLRCAVFPTKDGKWEYRYRATWAGFLCAGFTVKCDVTADGPGRWKVRGEKDLGPVFGGVFTHTATVTGDRLQAGYSAKMDQGVMDLRRVGVAGSAGVAR